MPKHARTEDIDSTPNLDETQGTPEREGQDVPDSQEESQTELAKEPSPEPKKHLTIRQKKSRRMRKVLIVVIILIVVLIGAVGYLGFLLFQEAQTQASQQSITQGSTDINELKDAETQDSSAAAKKEIEAPPLVSVLGKTQDEAVTLIDRGTAVISVLPVDEENNPIKSSVKLSLTDEPSAARLGTPTVYLDLNAEGHVISAGYSAAASSLGYGSSSFSDAINNKKIIENTFEEAGLSLPEGAVVLPRDKSLYSTYATDGTTLTNEQFSFAGSAEQNGTSYEWSAVLRYDYTAANSTGNLANTVRQVYIYVSLPGVAVAVPVETTPAA